jgi:hypothetical protein
MENELLDILQQSVQRHSHAVHEILYHDAAAVLARGQAAPRSVHKRPRYAHMDIHLDRLAEDVSLDYANDVCKEQCRMSLESLHLLVDKLSG